MGAAAYFFLAPRFPKDQSVNFVLGDSARDVTDVTVRYASTASDDVSRDVAMHFDRGRAPRVVHHEARLPDGEYLVDIDVRSARGAWTTERRVKLEGGSTNIDVSHE
ncbi:MAG TPA: hypothetical protein VGH28_13645 [Polyangiaceae bacterium]